MLFIQWERKKNQQMDEFFSISMENIYDTWDNSQFAWAVLVPWYSLRLLHQHHPKTLREKKTSRCNYVKFAERQKP